MPNLASSQKRMRQNVRRRARNRITRSALKTQVKKFLSAVHDGDPEVVGQQYSATAKLLDQTAAKGTIHRNTAARTKSRLAKRLAAVKAASA